ncbi:MAG: response regulator [Cyanobacteria bacterium P01_A01_bin.135]
MDTISEASYLIVVEDSDADFAALKRSFGKLNISNRVRRFESADDAITFLEDVYKDMAQAEPAVILLDLNMPGTDGRDFIVQVKQDDILKKIPIVVFTTSSNPKDIEFAYLNGANGYMVKPVSTTKFQDSMSSFKRYWLETNRLV